MMYSVLDGVFLTMAVTHVAVCHVVLAWPLFSIPPSTAIITIRRVMY